MSASYIDLHTHSTCSDGTLTPSELVVEARRAGLSALALTDHDCVAGIREARQAAMGSGADDPTGNTRKTASLPEIIPGVELSCEFEGKEIHILGLYIDEEAPVLTEHLRQFLASRKNRNEEMVRRLREEAGFPITMEALVRAYPGSVITRAHVARYLTEQGLVKDRGEVFAKYIGDGCRFYVPRPKITPQEGIALIHRAGGLAFLAHPVLYHMSAVSLDRLTRILTDSGLDGIEAVYSCYQPGDERNMRRLAGTYGLLISGGSDFHGANKPHIRLGMGTAHAPIPRELLEDIKKHALSDGESSS